MMKKTLRIDGGTETYEKSDVFCPQCGKKDVWVECGEGDFYVGSTHYCLNCFAVFAIPWINFAHSPSTPFLDQGYQQRIDMLRDRSS